MAPSKPADISDEDYRQVRAYAEREWPRDFAMRLHTEQEQFEAIRELRQGKPSDISPQEFEVIRRIATEQWPEDFGMRAHVWREQFEAVRELRRGRPDDISPQDFETVRWSAEKDWPDDFAMQAHIRSEQFAALRTLRGGRGRRLDATSRETVEEPNHNGGDELTEEREEHPPGILRDVRDFLSGFRPDDLLRRQILQPHKRYGYLLQGSSVEPLIQLMQLEGIDRLSHPPHWELRTDGRFRNGWARYRALIHYGDLDKAGDVFRDANKHINPFYGETVAAPEPPSRRVPASPVPVTRTPMSQAPLPRLVTEAPAPPLKAPAVVIDVAPPVAPSPPPEPEPESAVGRPSTHPSMSVVVASSSPLYRLARPAASPSRTVYLARRHARSIATGLCLAAVMTLVVSATPVTALFAVVLMVGSAVLVLSARGAEHSVDPAIEGPLLDLAAHSRGRLTVPQVARGLGIPLIDADQALNALARHGYASMENAQAGHIEYVFAEFTEGPVGESR